MHGKSPAGRLARRHALLLGALQGTREGGKHVHGNAWEPMVELHTSVCVREDAWVCVGMHGNVWECVEKRANEWYCVET